MKKTWLLAVLLVLIVALAGCAASYSGNAAQEPYYGGMASDEEIAPGSAPTESKNAQNNSFPLAEKEADPNAKIVWTGSVRMQTTDWSKTVEELSKLFTQYGVEVMSSEEGSGSSYYGSRGNAKNASYELRVPSEKFAEFFDALSTVNGSVMSATRSREDMTRSYNDNALKISLLETEYNELKELMEKADTVEEVLSIRDRMTGVLYEMESLNKANNQIDYDVSWSRVTLSLQEVIVYTEVEGDFGERVKVSFINGWASFASAMQEIFIFLLESLPWLLLMGAIAVLIVVLVKRGSKKRRARREAARAAQPPMRPPVPPQGPMPPQTPPMPQQAPRPPQQ